MVKWAMANLHPFQTPRDTAKRLALLISGAALMAFNINTFVHAGSLIPGGFTGLTLLIMEIGRRFWGLALPFSIILFILNAVPVFISFRYIGKWFSIYSCLVILLNGLLTDFMPPMFIELIQIHDTLLAAVFGGLLNALSVSLCLHAGATSGGTDFIAIFISEKYHRDAWNYIFAGNCVILVIAGRLFDLHIALYSIIFQFTTTMALNALYKGYQQMTLFVVTSRPDEVYKLIREETHHGATSFTGKGQYEKSERVMLYSVVSAPEVSRLVTGIKKIDPGVFINVIKTDHLGGRFYQRPKD
ncbi:membrane protein [Spirochaetia bacterium]|nr:membrane protein [Spirochaetia bacterium]